MEERMFESIEELIAYLKDLPETGRLIGEKRRALKLRKSLTKEEFIEARSLDSPLGRLGEISSHSYSDKMFGTWMSACRDYEQALEEMNRYLARIEAEQRCVIRMHHCMETLAITDWNLLEQVYIEKVPIKEISAIREVSETKISRHLRKVLARLMDLYNRSIECEACRTEQRRVHDQKKVV